MTLEETTELYASVLRQLVPVGGYDTSPNTEVLSKDICAHAKLLAQADLDAKRLLTVLEGFPPELISEYEAEYGLPLKCSINAGRTLAERIDILKWVKQTKNVLNREYLKQILAIFGVVLIDVVKFKPMQCITPCNAPINTERLRYKVLLRLQYPMTADMSCIIENYLPSYLRVEWVVDMPWGEWILNNGYSLIGNDIRYTAYKTNQREYYDSYANFDLVAVLVRSFHDNDMQQSQVVIDAINSLTGSTIYTFNNDKSEIIYPAVIRQDGWMIGGLKAYNVTLEQACHQLWRGTIDYDAKLCKSPSQWSGYVPIYQNITVDNQIITYEQLAQKIISNTSSNQGISLLAEAYIEIVAKSIFSTDSAKQFVKISDLLSQFEINKTLRT